VHLITLSFDDGFVRSFTRVAAIYERFGLSACFNIVADNREIWNETHVGTDVGSDWELWNALRARGHEIMPHGLHHVNYAQLPLSEATDSIRRCLDIFAERLPGFDPRQAVFNFPYNASSPALEAWLPEVARAYRTWGEEAINPLPHAGMTRLTCTAFGPGNCEQHLDNQLARLLAQPSGWLIYNTHGLDDEGWGPIGSDYLEALLTRLSAIPTVRLLPAGRALQEAN